MTTEPQWKSGNEFAPYHPSASRIRPEYRDGWNACYAAAQAHNRLLLAAIDAAREVVAAYDAIANTPTALFTGEEAPRCERADDALRAAMDALGEMG